MSIGSSTGTESAISIRRARCSSERGRDYLYDTVDFIRDWVLSEQNRALADVLVVTDGRNPAQVAETIAAMLPIGGVPPFGHTTHLQVVIDPDLLQYDEVWAAAATWHDVFALSPTDLERVSGGTLIDLKR